MEVEVSARGMVAVVLCDNPAVCVNIHFPDIFAATGFYEY